MAKGGELQRYVLTVTKNYSTTDTRQIPAAATCNFHFQGATVSGSFTVTSGGGTAVSVYDINDIKVGDTLEHFTEDNWGDSDYQMTVASITDQQTIVCVATPDVDVVVTNRLVIVGRGASQDLRPRIYQSDSLDGILNTVAGGFTTDGNAASDATVGEMSVYVQPRYFDLIISGTGLTTRLLEDQQAGQGRTFVNAAELGVYADADQAKSALNRVVLTDAFARIARPGHPVSKLWLPRGTTIIDEDIDLVAGSAATNLEIEGDIGAIVKPDDGFTDSKMFYIGAGLTGGKIKGVTFDGNTGNVTANILELTQGSSNLWLEDCIFQNIDGKALVLGAAGQDIDSIWIENCLFTGINDTAIEIISCVRAQINGNQFISVAETGGHAIEIAVASGDLGEIISIDGNHFTNVADESNNTSGQVLKAVGQAAAGGSTPNECFSISFSRNQIDTPQGTGTTPAVSVSRFYYIDVDGNKIRNGKGAGIVISGAYYLKANDNNVGLNNGTNGAGITVQNVSSIRSLYGTVSGNIVTDANIAGIYVSLSDGIQVGSNVLYNNNRVGSAGSGGIVLSNSTLVNMTGNTCISNDSSGSNGFGVYIDSGSSKCVLSSNTLEDHAGGAYSDNASDTVIVGNYEG